MRWRLFCVSRSSGPDVELFRGKRSLATRVPDLAFFRFDPLPAALQMLAEGALDHGVDRHASTWPAGSRAVRQLLDVKRKTSARSTRLPSRASNQCPGIFPTSSSLPGRSMLGAEWMSVMCALLVAGLRPAISRGRRSLHAVRGTGRSPKSIDDLRRMRPSGSVVSRARRLR